MATVSDGEDRSRLEQAMARIWAESAGLIRARVETIEGVAVALLEGALSPDARAEAARAAHSLAGTAGSFGFTRGGELAREAENILKSSDTIEPSAVLRLASLVVDLRRELVDVKYRPGAAAPAAEPAKARLIAVDDDPMLLALLSEGLKEQGFEVETLNDPTIAAARIAAKSPDLVILDVDMPGLDGISLCRKLREQPSTSATPVLFLTSRNEPSAVSEMFAAGGDDHVTKPVQLDQLVPRIRNRLARSQTRTGAPAAPVTQARSANFTVDFAIVDDDPALTSLLTHALQSRGHQTAVFSDGTSAIAALGGSAPQVRPAIILLDVSLPGMDGLAVLRSLARDGITDRSRVIMLTARSSESETLQALELGAHDHIAKPFSLPVLMQRVRRALESIDQGR
jgi:DNA-binding response OmpR family regulator